MKYLLITLSVILAVIFIPRFLSINKRKEYKVVDNVYTYIDLLGAKEEKRDTSEDIQLLDSLVETYERTFDHKILLTVGEMYARGSFPRYSPDDNSALRIYKIASTCPDSEVASMAMSKMVETRMEPVPLEDRSGPSLPLETVKRLTSCAENHIKKLPLSAFMRKSSSTEYNKVRRNSLQRPIVEIIRVPEVPAQVVTAPAVTITRNAPEFNNQKQNVHDHGVGASLRANVKSLKEEFPDMDYNRSNLIESTMDKLRNSNVPEKSMGKIFNVLVSLVPDEISSIKCSQMDTLYLLTKKLDSIEDKTLRKNAYETLGKNLESGVEHGHVVCSTGKISRIVSTLEGLDIGMQKSIHMDAVKKEIENLASKIRTDVLDEASDQNKTSYDTDDCGNLGSKMRGKLDSEVERIYSKELGMSKKILDPLVKVYASAY